MGLDPGIPGSLPETKADAQPLSHPGVPGRYFQEKNESEKNSFKGDNGEVLVPRYEKL